MALSEHPVTDAGDWNAFWTGHPNSQDLTWPFRSAPERATFSTAVRHGRLAAGMRVLELGCGGARLLPRLGANVGVEIAGIDFSELGVEQTKATCRALGVSDSEIELGDIFEYTKRHADEFDLVFSIGLVEHFPDVSDIVLAHVQCARPGGRVFVVAPNLSGLQLAWTKRVASTLFLTDAAPGVVWHRPIAAAEVADDLCRFGALEIETTYLGGPRLWANPEKRGRPEAMVLSERLVRKLVNGFGEATNRVSSQFAGAIARKEMSPWFGVAGTKPASRL